MKNLNRLRTLTVFMAIASLLFLGIAIWFEIDVPQEAMEITELVAAAFVALGILADTGKVPQPLSWQSVLEKLKSPIGVGSLFALLTYIVYLRMAPAEADVILKVLDTLIVAVFGFSVYNNPNSRTALR